MYALTLNSALALALLGPAASDASAPASDATTKARLDEIFGEDAKSPAPDEGAAPAPAPASAPAPAPAPASAPASEPGAEVPASAEAPAPGAEAAPEALPSLGPSAFDEVSAEEASPPEEEASDAAPEAAVETEAAPKLPPSPVWPDIPVRWRVEFMIGAGTSSFYGRDYTFFDDDDRRMVNPVVELRADAKLAGPFYLGGGFGYRFGESSASPFGDGQSSLKLHEPRGFMRFSYEPVQGVDVYGDLALGLAVVDYVVELDTRSEERRYAFVGDALVGTALSLPKRWLPRRGSSRTTVGLDFGIGYSYRSPVEIQPSFELDDEPISTDFSSFGKLSLHGLTWRLGVFVRFM